MQWVKERVDALREVAGIRAYILLATVTAGAGYLVWVVEAATGYGLLTLGLPKWAAAVIVLLFVTWVWLLEYVVRQRRRLRGARLDLATLRSEGVAIRNEIIKKNATPEAFDDWIGRSLEWNDRVIAALKNISLGDAEWFSVLDIVPPPRIDIEVDIVGGGSDFFVNDERRKRVRRAFQHHDFRLARLGEMIQRLWGNEFI
jgi:hypothetical protein